MGLPDVHLPFGFSSNHTDPPEAPVPEPKHGGGFQGLADRARADYQRFHSVEPATSGLWTLLDAIAKRLDELEAEAGHPA
jgi:hypothetical protein